MLSPDADWAFAGTRRLGVDRVLARELVQAPDDFLQRHGRIVPYHLVPETGSHHLCGRTRARSDGPGVGARRRGRRDAEGAAARAGARPGTDAHVLVLRASAPTPA